MLKNKKNMNSIIKIIIGSMITLIISIVISLILYSPALIISAFTSAISGDSFVSFKEWAAIAIEIFFITYLPILSLFSKKRKIRNFIIAICVTALLACIGNGINKGIENIEQEEYEKLLAEKTVVEQISFNINDTAKVNVDNAYHVLKEEAKYFANIAQGSSFREDDLYCYNIGCGYNIRYGDSTNSLTCDEKRVKYNYYPCEITNENNIGSIKLVCAHIINEENANKLDIDFVIKDMENFFGEIENEELLRKTIQDAINYATSTSDYTTLIFDSDWSSNFNNFKTEQGAIINVYVTIEGIEIGGAYVVQPPRGEFKENEPSDISLFERILNRLNTSPHSFLEIAEDEARKDHAQFKTLAPRVYSDDFRAYPNDRIYYNLNYNQTINFVSEKGGYDISGIERDINFYNFSNIYELDFICYIRKGCMENVSTNFLVNDVENIVGKLEDRKGFEEALIDKINKCKTSTYKEHEDKSVFFKTVAGLEVELKIFNDGDIYIVNKYKIDKSSYEKTR